MADQKIILTSTNPGGQTLQKTLTDINPDASNAQLKTFGQKLNALTNNTYGKTDRIIKYNCDTESGGGSITPTFTLDRTSVSWAELRTTLTASTNNWYSIAVTYNGDGKLFVNTGSNIIGAITDDQNSTIMLCSPFSGGAYPSTISEPVIVTITAEETDNFKAAEATFTVTA